MTRAPRGGTADATERYSPVQAAFFAAYFTRFFRKHMNALRVAELDKVRALDGSVRGPLIVYTNHPSWWDGALYVLLPRHCFPSRRAYGPIEAAMLRKYSFFGRIGGFGLDLDSPRGAADFLRQSERILRRDDSLLWIPAQGEFADVRRRPLAIKPGVGRLCEMAPGATVMPAAFDYPFWSERGAEALVRFGEPMGAASLAALGREARVALLEQRLTETLDRLAADAQSRDPARFDAAISGSAGVGGLYAAWRHAAAALRGKRWDGHHSATG